MNTEDTLRANNPGWKIEARKLMEQKKAFVVVEWTQHFDEPDVKGLAQEFDYSLAYRDKHPSQAFFSPRESN